jgi:hypothetical protein
MTRGRLCLVQGCGRRRHARDWCLMHYRRIRKTGSLGPSGSTRDRGGRITSLREGYVRVWRPAHPLAGEDGYVYEHRLVAWEAGLLTDPTDHVHHRNGDKQDNRVENLEVLSNSAHQRNHHAAPGRSVRNGYGTYEIAVDAKTCPRCGKRKPLGAFGRRRSGRPETYCRPCAAAKTMAYRRRAR